jgi:hypothetical protein
MDCLLASALASCFDSSNLSPTASRPAEARVPREALESCRGWGEKSVKGKREGKEGRKIKASHLGDLLVGLLGSSGSNLLDRLGDVVDGRGGRVDDGLRGEGRKGRKAESGSVEVEDAMRGEGDEEERDER